jgi:predicted ester cyclase
MGDGLDAAKLRSRRLYEEVFDQFGEDDRVVCRWAATRTHTGPLTRPSGPVAPTGRRISFEEIRIDRHAGGKIAESWFMSDRLTIWAQLGLLPGS